MEMNIDKKQDKVVYFAVCQTCNYSGPDRDTRKEANQDCIDHMIENTGHRALPKTKVLN
jgi:hypothetical protein